MILKGKKLSDISIKWQLLFICILLVSVPLITLGIISYNSVKDEINLQTQDTLLQSTSIVMHDINSFFQTADQKKLSDLKIAKSLFYEKGEPYLDDKEKMEIKATNQITKESKTITVSTMKQNGKKIAYDYSVIDKVKNLVGGTSTIFQIIPDGMIRISTNVINTDGSRAVGTFIPKDSPVYQTIMKGDIYAGRAFVVNAWYMAAYEPIKDKDGNIIGALYVGVSENEYQESIKNSLKEIKIGKTGYIYILENDGKYALSAARKRDGENIINATDASGKKFIQSILDKSKALKNEEHAVEKYPWKNNGETFPRMKVAVFEYFAPWGWTVASSAYEDEFYEQLNSIMINTVIICVIAILIGSVIAYIFAERMTKKFNFVIKKMDEAANGDLSVQIDEQNISQNEVGKIEKSFVIMLNNLKKLVTEISTNTSENAATAEEFSVGSEELNSTSHQVAIAVTEIAKGAQQLSKFASDTEAETKRLIDSINEVSDAAQRTSSIAKDAADASKKGSDAAKKAQERIETMHKNANDSENVVRELGDKIKQITKVVEVINSISEETNLLALNAAIEAARAGDAGRGFAVVADEVRKLAEQSQKSTKQIEEMIAEIIESTQKAVTAIGDGGKEIVIGGEVISQALDSLETINKKINQVSNEISTIHMVTKQQVEISENVQKSVHSLNSIAEQSAASTEEVSASIQETSSSTQQIALSSQNLAKSAEELKQMISKFKTK